MKVRTPTHLNNGEGRADGKKIDTSTRLVRRGSGRSTLGVTHPSLPHYLAVVAGDDFVVKDNNPSCFASDLLGDQARHHIEGDTLVDQFESSGLSCPLR